jgi:hypothetical protein
MTDALTAAKVRLLRWLEREARIIAYPRETTFGEALSALDALRGKGGDHGRE